MNSSIFKLDNVVQNYAWGSKTSMTDLFGISNPDNLPQAELWMGAHPNGCSKLNNSDDQGVLLSDMIDNAPEQMLGRYTSLRYHELPFLLKVLAAAKPLSIQVHPEKSKAQQGFALENEKGIPLDSPERNYKDDNHKPELIYALTHYEAMNGFRAIDEIVALFEQSGCQVLAPYVASLKNNPTSMHLSVFFRTVLSLDGEQKVQAIAELLEDISNKGKDDLACETFVLIEMLAEDYPGDIGLFAPLMLNVIELQPGEAMFLDAETPHAYIRGSGIEIMANSDNVLRAGLTPKHIDIDELIHNTRFEPIPFSDLKLRPQVVGHKQVFHVPVDDFRFEILNVAEVHQTEFVRSAEILFCIEGEVTVNTSEESLTLSAGESAFVKDEVFQYQYQGSGIVARACN